MAGITPNEGEELIGNVVYKRTHADRDADLELRLITNVSVTETMALSSITEPSGGGYAAITLTDSSWTVTGDTATYATQTFSATSTYTGQVNGYAVVTKSTGGTARLLHIELDPAGPFDINTGDTYSVRPSITVA